MSEIASPPPAPSNWKPATVPPAYRARVLPVEEWERLRALPFGKEGLPDPQLAMIVVVENADGQIVGTWAAQTMVMLDGLWKDPEAAKEAPVAPLLLRTMKDLLREREIVTSFTLISDPQVMVLAVKAGFTRASGDLWMLQLDGEH